jgi:CubicO group peptidase (beta-lactamase class C family)
VPRRRIAASVIAVAAVLLSACASSSSPVHMTYALGHFPAAPTGSFSSYIAGTFQAVLDKAIKEEGLPGISATVMTADGQSWTGAAGTADGVHPIEALSQFGIASITKTVIAAEIMRLSEQGLLSLSDPISKHLPPSFHFDSNGATIQNLLHMESGIPDPTYFGPSDAKANPLRDWTPEEVLATVPAIRSTPGDHYVYEDANYMLLGLVIRQTTGLSVAATLRSDVLADPRLASMVYQPAEQPQGPLALPFLGAQVRPNILAVGGGYLPTRAEASYANGSGCMASDSRALALWGYLLFGGKLVAQQSLLAMTNFGNSVYGLGVINQTRTGAWSGGGQAIGNGGWDDGGYASALVVLPSKGIVISVMTNMAGDPTQLVFPVAAMLASSL